MAEHLTGLDIPHLLLVDMTGFEAVVDAFGGVTMTVPEPVHGPLYHPVTGDYEMIRIERGEQTLDGDEALAYSRARLDDSDYARMARQRRLLTALVDNVNPVSLLAGWADLLETIETHLTTDLPLDVVPNSSAWPGTCRLPTLAVVGFGPDRSSRRTSGGYAIPDVEESGKRCCVRSPISLGPGRAHGDRGMQLNNPASDAHGDPSSAGADTGLQREHSG